MATQAIYEVGSKTVALTEVSVVYEQDGVRFAPTNAFAKVEAAYMPTIFAAMRERQKGNIRIPGALKPVEDAIPFEVVTYSRPRKHVIEGALEYHVQFTFNDEDDEE